MKAEIYNNNGWISKTDPEEIKEMFDRLLSQCDFTVMGFIEQKFKPEGYTAIWVLAESHLAVHTFPEHGTTYIELSSCSKDKQELFVHKFKRLNYGNIKG